MLILFAMCKEECVLYIFGFSLYLLINKKYSYSSVAFLISLSIILLNNIIVQPYFVNKSGMLNPTTLSFWAQWGTTKTQIITNMLHHPAELITGIFKSDSGFWKLYGWFGFIVLFDPFLLLTSIFVLFLNGTTQNMTMFHYEGYAAVTLNIIFFISLIRSAHIKSNCFHIDW